MHSLGKCCDLEDVFAGRARSHRVGVQSHRVGVHSHRVGSAPTRWSTPTGGGPFYREGLTLEGAGLPGSDLQDIIRAAAGFLDDDVDEVQLGDHGRWQHEGVEIGLTHGA